jgi:tetraacyldisaccharide 4'-kinase
VVKPHSFLLPLAWVYQAGVRLRNLLFDAGVLKQRGVSVPVVSVGNIAAGGVGKTPFVEELSRRLRARGVRVGILSRGYGRRGRGQRVVSAGDGPLVPVMEAGDEAAMLADHVPDVAVVVDSDRVSAARTAVTELGCNAVILDDGFQHRWLRRDLDIVLVPAKDLLSRQRMLPAGYLREPFSSLRRSHVVVISRCEGLSQFREVAGKARTFAPRAQLIGVQHVAVGLKDAGTGSEVGAGSLSSRAVVVVSGIADAVSFERSVIALGLRVVRHLVYADHHWYADADLSRISEVCRKEKADRIVTTEKDVIRMRALGAAFAELTKQQNVVTVSLRLKVLEGEDVLQGIVESVRGRVRVSP